MKRKLVFVSFIVLVAVLNGAFASDMKGVIACYPLDGNAQDVSGNGNHGIAHCVTPVNDRFGAPNGAVWFDGISSYIDIGSVLNQVNNTEAFTLSMFIRADDLANYPSGKTFNRYQLARAPGVWPWALKSDFSSPAFSSTGSDASFQPFRV